MLFGVAEDLVASECAEHGEDLGVLGEFEACGLGRLGVEGIEGTRDYLDCTTVDAAAGIDVVDDRLGVIGLGAPVEVDEATFPNFVEIQVEVADGDGVGGDATAELNRRVFILGAG